MEVCKQEDMNWQLQKYYKNIFTEINETIDDFETLKIGIEIIKIAKERLNSDLYAYNIFQEYNKLGKIIEELEEIKNNYV